MLRTKVLLLGLALVAVCQAKDIKTVVLKTQPEMHCENCEKKIKDNIRFEKGVKSIKTDLQDKTVTIEYDADKTCVENIIAGFKKINYEASEQKACCQDKEQKACCQDKEKKACCQEKKQQTKVDGQTGASTKNK